jgi:hypothetical protein
MKASRLRTSALLLTLVATLGAATPSFAGQRGRDRGPDRRGGVAAPRAVPRGSVRPGRVYRNYGRVVPYRSYRGYGPNVRFGAYYGYPGYFGPGVFGAPFWGSGYWGGYPYRYGYPYANGYSYGYEYGDPYGYGGAVVVGPGRASGGIRIDVPERDAEVLVDGYYAGIVDDFDGVMQQLQLEPGPHRVEIRLDGFEPVTFEVDVRPGRTITYRTQLRPLP